MDFNYLLIFILINALLLFFCRKYSLLKDEGAAAHKKFVLNKESYLIGGLILLTFFIYYYFSKNSFSYIFFFISIFFIGILSDLKILNNPKKRFILQIALLIFFVVYLDIKIIDTRIDLLNHYLNNIYFNKFFVIFCLMVLINGGNFVDGLNTLLLGYYCAVLSVLVFFLQGLVIEINLLQNLILVFLSILLYNFCGYIFLGDSGAYLISLFMGLFLINLSFHSSNISPYFVILLVWYPCFEVLFSMVRRTISNKFSYYPDTKHLHQIIYLHFKLNMKKSNIIAQILTSIVINGFNFLVFYIGSLYYEHTSKLILIIIFNIVLYLSIYFFFNSKNIKTNFF